MLYSQGREDVVHQIRDYVLGTCRKPLVLYGLSGCGKTSLMAKAASQVTPSHPYLVFVYFMYTCAQFEHST